MLFALEWIREAYRSISDSMQRFISGLTFPAIESALTGTLWILIPCAVGGLALCFCGFKLHKLVSGLAGGALLGWLGWNLGVLLNPGLTTVPILYMSLMAALGFILLYIAYVLNIFAAGFLLACASCASLPGISAGARLFASLAFAVLYCFLYVRRKEIMSALTGAILLGLIAGGLWGTAPGAAVCSACTAGGILAQRALKKKDDERITAEEEAQRAKYPYGPGVRDKQKAARLARLNGPGPEEQNSPRKDEGESK